MSNFIEFKNNWLKVCTTVPVTQALLSEIERLQEQIERLHDLIIQYRDDLKRPPTDHGSIQRRLEAIDAVLNPSVSETKES